jgi:hypothetical protein
MRKAARMNTVAEASPLAALFCMPNTVPRQSTKTRTCRCDINSGTNNSGMMTPMASSVVVLSPNLTPFSSLEIVIKFSGQRY